MQNKQNVFFFFILTIFIFSCNKDDSSPSGIFSVKINGVKFIPDSSEAILLIDSSIGLRSLFVGGFTGEKYILAGFEDFDLSPQLLLNHQYADSQVIVYYLPDSIDNNYNPSHGKFIITDQDQVNKKVSGIFSGKMINPDNLNIIEITDGKFNNLPYKLEISN